VGKKAFYQVEDIVTPFKTLEHQNHFQIFDFSVSPVICMWHNVFGKQPYSFAEWYSGSTKGDVL